MKETISSNTETAVYQKLRKLLQKSCNENKAFALWSLPSEEHFHMLVSDEINVVNENFQIENSGEGFIIAPFDPAVDKTLFLKKDLYWNSTLNFPEIELEEQGSSKIPDNYSRQQPINTSSEQYLKMVQDAVKEIEAGNLIKAVPARAKTTSLPESFDNLEFFLTLTRHYPDAFISWLSIPDVGSWFGASPEILIEVKGDIFKTVSLAGTQPFEASHSVRDTSWTQKEIEEQALVSRYIINCFKKIRLREYDESGPRTVRAGNLLHLKTEYSVNMRETNFPDLGSIMLKLLHPTSAICGMPLENAKMFLKQNEGFSRSYFSGYLGPVNINNSSNLYVNLRCLQLLEDQVITYAGAGVTIDSDPARELNETEIKMNTLLRLLK